MLAVVSGNQMLNFNNIGSVKGNHQKLTFAGNNYLDRPSFRLPKSANGRNLQIKGRIHSQSDSGVIYAHGDHQNGYAVYMSKGHLAFTTCVNGKNQTITTDAALTKAVDFEAGWNHKGTMVLKINKKLVGRHIEVGVLSMEPGESIQIGGDARIPVASYDSPNGFSGTIENLTTKHPTGS